MQDHFRAFARPEERILVAGAGSRSLRPLRRLTPGFRLWVYAKFWNGKPEVNYFLGRANFELGKTAIKLEGATLPIYDRERTIVDAFRYLGRETALKALKMALTKKGAEKIDIEKIRKYAKKLRVKIEPFLIAMTL